MYLMAAFVTGGVAYAGARVYQRHRRRRTTVWLKQHGQAIETSATIVEEPDLPTIERRITTNLHLATFSLGLTTAGVLIYAPLVLASIPFNLYDAVMMFEDAWEMILAKGPLATVLTSSSVVVITMLADLYLITALVQWLYFLNQKLVLLLLRSEFGPILMRQRQVGPVVGAYAV
jgi:hypothetical protein